MSNPEQSSHTGTNQREAARAGNAVCLRFLVILAICGAMTTLHNKFPDKHIYFSEGSVFGMEGAAQIITFLRHWARSYNVWVTIIDHRAQPNPGPHDCSPTCIVLNSDTLALDYRFDYYMYGQFMKFIRPGAVRIHSDLPSKSLPNVAVRNSDGAIVLVVTNLKNSPARFAVTCGDGAVINSAAPTTTDCGGGCSPAEAQDFACFRPFCRYLHLTIAAATSNIDVVNN